MPRIAITGVGLVTPLGPSAEQNVARICEGESGIAPAQAFSVEGHAAKALAKVPEFDLESSLRFPKNYKFMSRPVRFAMRAAREAIGQSALDWGQLAAGAKIAKGEVLFPRIETP